MKISDLANRLEAIQEDYGDIDVVCVVPGCSPDFDRATVTDDHLEVRTADPYDGFDGITEGSPYLNIGE